MPACLKAAFSVKAALSVIHSSYRLEPSLCEIEVRRHEVMAGRLPVDLDVRARLLQQASQALGLLLGDQRIHLAVRDQDPRPLQRRQRVGLERDLRPEQYAALQPAWRKQDDRRRDVRAVGESHRDDAGGIELVVRGGRADEVRELVGADLQVLDVEDALGQAPEEPGVSVFQHLAARAQHRRAWREVRKRQHLVLVAAGAVQEGQRRSPEGPGRLEDVLKAEVGRHCRTGIFSGGSARSISARAGSYQGGRTSDSPRREGSSSTAKPGPSVAISNSTPPGSLKYTDLNQKRSMTSVARPPAASTCARTTSSSSRSLPPH